MRGGRGEEEPGKQQPMPDMPQSVRKGNLPLRLSSLVGRGREIGGVRRLLAENRLLTLFSNPPDTDEGKTFFGQKTGRVVDGSGKGAFTFSTSSKELVGQTITATATNEFTGDTSEFSAARTVVAP